VSGQLMVIGETPESGERLLQTLRLFCEPAGWTCTSADNLLLRTPSHSDRIRLPTVAVIEVQQVEAAAVKTAAQWLGSGSAVILLSHGDSTDEWEERAYVTGVTAVLAFPVRAPRLRSLLQRIQPPAPVSARADRPKSQPSQPAAGVPRALPQDLLTVAAFLRTSDAPEAFYEAHLNRLKQDLAAGWLALYLVRPAAVQLDCVYATGLAAGRAKTAKFLLNRGACLEINLRGVVLSLDAQDATMSEDAEHELEACGARVAVPVHDGETIVGLLLAGAAVDGRAYGPEELRFLFAAGESLGAVARLESLNSGQSAEARQLAAAFDALPTACVFITSRGAVTTANPAARALWGGGLRAIGDLPADIASLAHRARAATACPQNLELRRTDRVLHVTALSVKTGGVVLTATDLTGFDHQSRLAAEARREDLLRAMGASLSHNLNNALTKLSTFGQLWAAKKSDASFLDALGIALRDDLQRVRRYTAQLEELGRPADSGEGQEFRIDEVLDAAWASAVKALHPAPDALPQLRRTGAFTARAAASPDAVRLVLFELLINALQAAPGAESVLVEVTESQTQILIAVHDDGDGFSHLPLPATTLFWTSKNQGLGLGLALARRAVTAAGGMLAVSRSARLKGSVVTTVWNKT